MKIRASSLVQAIQNAPAPERDGQRHDVDVNSLPGVCMKVETITLIAKKFMHQDRRWFEWTVEV